MIGVLVSEFRSPTRITGSEPVAGPPLAISSLACAWRTWPLPTSVSLFVWLLGWLSNASRCVLTNRNDRVSLSLLLPLTLALTLVQPRVTLSGTPPGVTWSSVPKVPLFGFERLDPPTLARIASRMVRRPSMSHPAGVPVISLPSVLAQIWKSNSGFAITRR